MNTTFVLIDQSQGAKTASGESLTAPLLRTLAKAYDIFLNLHFAAVYGGSYLVRIDSQWMPGEVPCKLLPLLPQPDGGTATAFHDDAGGAIIVDGVGDSDSLYGPGNSHSVAITHEIPEALCNWSINAWNDQNYDPTAANVQTAHEVCDPVEGQSFVIAVDGLPIHCSNFVLPAWFDPGATGPFDYMTSRGIPGAIAPAGPFELANGYRSDRDLLSRQIQQVGLATRRPGTISRRAWALGVR